MVEWPVTTSAQLGNLPANAINAGDRGLSVKSLSLVTIVMVIVSGDVTSFF